MATYGGVRPPAKVALRVTDPPVADGVGPRETGVLGFVDVVGLDWIGVFRER